MPKIMGTKNTRKTIGERIKEKRQTLNLSLEEVAHELGLPVKLIIALEEDNYGFFSARVYAFGIFKKVTRFLNMEGADQLFKEFDSEWNVGNRQKMKGELVLPENRGTKPFVTPKTLGSALILIFVVLFGIFLGSRFYHFVDLPEFALQEPETKESVVSVPWIRIKGRAEKESSLTVNGRGVTIDENGFFDEELELAAGLNTLDFIVESKFGKINRETRHVLVK